MALADLYKGNSMYQEIRITDQQKIENTIEDLRTYYGEDNEYTFREAIGYNYTSSDLESDKIIIQNKLSVVEITNDSQPTDYAKNIIGLISSGQNPFNYNDNDYVSDLKTLVDEFTVESSSNQIAWSILALDMAEADYNFENSVDALINTQNADNSFGGFGGDVDTTAMVLMALANHRDLDGVEECISSSLEYIKLNQGENGGFISWGSESLYSTAAAIQGLIAVGEDPLSEEWTKESGMTPLDFLLTFKVDNHFETSYEFEGEMIISIDSPTEQAFMALADLYKGNSMYQEIRITNQQQIENENLTMERVGSGAFNRGEEAHLQVNIENGAAESKEVTLLIALYDTNNNKMVNYTYLTKTIAADKAENISGGFLISQSGDYAVRAFLWDNLEDQNALTQPIDVSVE
jgi:hypothetical protein